MTGLLSVCICVIVYMICIAFGMIVDDGTTLPCAVLFSYTAPHDVLSVRDVGHSDAATAAVIESPLLSNGMWKC